MGRSSLALALSMAALSCHLDEGSAVGVDVLDSGGDGTLADASSDAPDAGDDAAPGDGGDGGDASDAGPCLTGLPGPALVPVSDAGYCIDSTEVTNADYAKFLVAVKADAGPQAPAYCGKNTAQDWAAGAWTVGKDESRPVVQVDWCDAYWFCKWAGKRLCGDRAGGALAPADMITPKGQWQYACTGGTANAYPYGPTYDPLRCNGAAAGKGGTVDAGAMAGCLGGVPGLHDMSGNVWEWIDSCTGNSSASDHCANGAGGWQDGDPNILKCKGFDILSPRTDKGPQTGFRCCSP